MADAPEKPLTPVERVGLEKDRSKVELYRPASILRTTEWGLLTVTSLLAALAFPPYFIAVLWSAFFSAGGMLWVTHLSESGRLRLKDFEREFSLGHQLEEGGQYLRAAEFYATLAPKFQDFPKIAEIALRRIEHLRSEHPQAFADGLNARGGVKGRHETQRSGTSRLDASSPSHPTSKNASKSPKPSKTQQESKSRQDPRSQQGSSTPHDATPHDATPHAAKSSSPKGKPKARSRAKPKGGRT